MAAEHFGRIRTILCETNPALRSGLHAALYGKGFREILICRDSTQMIETISTEIVDLIICDVEMPGVPFCDMVQLIRQKSLGLNPFALIIATLNESSLPLVRKVIGAGVDDVICKPMPMNLITEHVSSLLRGRRPFIATESYVGPNRRQVSRPADDDNLIVVPNSLRSKAIENADGALLQSLIEQGWTRVQSKKLCGVSGRVDRLTRRILAYYEGKGRPEDLARDLGRLIQLSQDLVAQYRETASDHIAELAASLAEVAGRLARTIDAPRKVHVELLARLGDSIGLALVANTSAADLAATMAAAVGRMERTA